VSNPLLKSEDRIRLIILEKTPLGISKKGLTEIIKKDIKTKFDATHVLNSASEADRISMYLGNNYLEDSLFDTAVYAIWDFEGDSNRVKINIRKEIDGI